jgi:hypothetical protein
MNGSINAGRVSLGHHSGLLCDVARLHAAYESQELRMRPGQGRR